MIDSEKSLCVRPLWVAGSDLFHLLERRLLCPVFNGCFTELYHKANSFLTLESLLLAPGSHSAILVPVL